MRVSRGHYFGGSDGPRPQVSPGRVHDPPWACNRGGGNELFYQSLEGAMMVVSIQVSPRFLAGVPRQLFPNRRYMGAGGAGGMWLYDVAPDGRFLMNRREGNPGPGQIMIGVVQNWTAELKTLLRPWELTLTAALNRVMA